ncbi:MAG: hypothetical protein WC865_13740 [Bacteroidales bacterium]
MYKTIPVSLKQLFAVFRSMGDLKQSMEPDFIREVNLNFETSRDALDILLNFNDTGEERNERLKYAILEHIFYEIDPVTLPESVSQEIRDQIPLILLNQ